MRVEPDLLSLDVGLCAACPSCWTRGTQPTQAHLVWWTRDTGFGNDSRNVTRRRHVERGIGHLHPLRGDAYGADSGHLAWCALLDRDAFAIGQSQVHR